MKKSPVKKVVKLDAKERPITKSERPLTVKPNTKKPLGKKEAK